MGEEPEDLVEASTVEDDLASASVEDDLEARVKVPLDPTHELFWDNYMSEREVEMLLVFQREVAERLVARVNTKEMSRLSVLAQYVCHTSLVYHLPSTVFVPQPKVKLVVF